MSMLGSRISGSACCARRLSFEWCHIAGDTTIWGCQYSSTEARVSPTYTAPCRFGQGGHAGHHAGRGADADARGAKPRRGCAAQRCPLLIPSPSLIPREASLEPSKLSVACCDTGSEHCPQSQCCQRGLCRAIVLRICCCLQSTTRLASG